MAIAWVFPGQGSQKVGMADGLLELPWARERFKQASELMDRDLLAICQGRELERYGTLSNLNLTRNSQPALFVVESLLVDGLIAQGRRPELVAGHSLGELVALYAAGVLDFHMALILILKRSLLMATARRGAMTAVMGFDRLELDELVAATEGVVIANDNSCTQVVLSGAPEAVAALCGSLRCKRAIPLAVCGAFHSPLMAEAAEAFATELEAVPFADSTIPVLSNTDPTPETSGAALRDRLRRQMTSGVRWRETMDALAAAGVDTAVEVGPGNVLSGLFKRSCPAIATARIAGIADLGA